MYTKLLSYMAADKGLGDFIESLYARPQTVDVLNAIDICSGARNSLFRSAGFQRELLRLSLNEITVPASPPAKAIALTEVLPDQPTIRAGIHHEAHHHHGLDVLAAAIVP
ncbi:hypothetical protein RDn1_141 [Candidatus Termititenax dinenymphae]|uniref:Uncharacterized protein n=1 Tax=Candidatus Termititenax dinenymphae TaxID=2218523 RepID=A0A388TK92_9BACT|nr:hypothetical protein RDn1_141 [Candidatus Termititenax dinenymphae]